MKFKNITKGIIYASALTVGVMYLTEVAYAKFDVDAGVAAATDPIIKAIKDHWGKAVFLAGGGSALLGDGDLRQRGFNAAKGVGVAGGVLLGMAALLT